MQMRNGVDITEICRIERSLQREGFIRRVFSPEEQEYFRAHGNIAQTAAGLYAAKEAFSKAMGVGLTGFLLPEASVLHDENGTPYFRFSGRAAALAAGWRFSLSISHDGGIAAAFVTAFQE